MQKLSAKVPTPMSEVMKKEMVRHARIMAFHCECEALGPEALPSQIERLRARAINLFEPKDYDFCRRAAAQIGVDLNLPENKA